MLRHDVKLILKLIIASALSLNYISAFAEAIESNEHIISVTKDFVIKHVDADPTDNINVIVGDTNFKLSKCDGEIQPTIPSNMPAQQISAIEIACNGSNKWHVFVPVTVQINTKVVVAKRIILPNEIIHDEDLDFTNYDKSRLYNGYFSSKQELAGTTVAHLTPAGTVLTKKNTLQPIVIHNNQTINLTARSNTVTVTTQAIAKSDGRLNGVIKVQNPSSKRILDAVVVGPNKAEIVS